MCGIAGLTRCRASGPVLALCRKLDEILSHRGPNDRGWLIHGSQGTLTGSELPQAVESAELVLLHRRLSIIDLTKAGWQPMTSPDGTVHIVFNGEIYNYLELRSELEKVGVTFTSNCDTEVLLAAFLQWGVHCLERLVGMFAFAVFDRKTRRLFLARDFFGIKPLYYVEWQGGLAFASEIKALLVLPGVSRNVNARRLYQYLRHGKGDSADSTFFQAIRQVPPGSYIDVSLSADRWPEPERYWSPRISPQTDLSFEAAAAKLRQLFLDSVTLHLRSDVPLGACLSGGIDSSAIVHAIRRIGGPKVEIHTFTYADSDPSLGEERWADLVNEKAGAHAHKVRLSPSQLKSDFQALISLQDEPFLSTSIYAQFCVFRAAREAGMIVMLDGQGADEMLAGYRPFLGIGAASHFWNGRWKSSYGLIRESARLPGMTLPQLLRGAAGALLPTTLSTLTRGLLERHFSPSWLELTWFQARDAANPPLKGIRKRDLLKSALVDSLTESTLPSLLRYEDRNSMAFSLESRVPFLVPSMAEFILSLPEDFIIGRDATTKRIFRTALRGLVPDEILDRRDKLGFVTSEHRWLSELRPWVEGVLSSDAAKNLPFLRPGKIRQILERRGASSEPFLWRWLNLIEWSRHYQVTFN